MAQKGTVLIHSRHLRPIKNSYPWGITGEYARQVLTKKAWQNCNCYPKLGVDLTFWDFDNKQVLGYGLASTAFIEPVYFTHSKTNFSLRFGMGIAYLSKPHDPVSNPDNLSYSLHWEFPVVLAAGVNHFVSPEISVKLSLRYNHISNGGIHLPNKGINYPTAGLGLDYYPKSVSFSERPKGNRVPPTHRNRFTTYYISSLKNAYAGDPTQYYIWGIQAKYSRHIGRSSALLAGTDWESDGSRKVRISNSDDPDRLHQRASIYAGHEFWLGKITFGTQVGVYYLDQMKKDDPVYHRWELTYLIKDHISAGLGIKAHRHIADIFDVRVGLVIPK